MWCLDIEDRATESGYGASQPRDKLRQSIGGAASADIAESARLVVEAQGEVDCLVDSSNLLRAWDPDSTPEGRFGNGVDHVEVDYRAPGQSVLWP